MNRMKQLFIAVITLFAVVSCGTKEEQGWTVNGTLNGLTGGTIIFSDNSRFTTSSEHPLTDGKFTLTGDKLSEPKEIYIKLKDVEYSTQSFYVENGINTFTADAKEYSNDAGSGISLSNIKIEGSIVNTHKAEVDKLNNAAIKKLYSVKSEEEQAAVIKEMDEILINFIKNNPTAHYSGILVARLTSGKSRAEADKLFALVPDLKSSHILEAKEKMSKDVDISEIVKASNVSYKVDTNFDGSAFKTAKYLGMLSNGNLVALNNDKTATIIDGNGKKVKSFTVSSSAVPSTMAVDNNNNIYVLVPEEKETEVTVRGKKVKRNEIVGYICDVYDANGTKGKSFKIEGVKKATGARFADGKLLIADMGGANIGIFNATTGAKEANIGGMRPCCGILDFSINNKNEVLVANLGAFRVQSYDLKGKQILAFGSRGNGLSEFHGCCNPVSVAYLSNGAIVTVEKDPTRVKVYSKEGAIAISGIDEMVKGCSYIPMTVDAKDNLYLASPTKGVVRCVAI